MIETVVRIHHSQTMSASSRKVIFAALAGVALALITGMMVFNGLTSIAIGLIPGATAVRLPVETRS